MLKNANEPYTNEKSQEIRTGNLLKLISILLSVIRDERGGVQMVSTCCYIKRMNSSRKIIRPS